MRLEELKLELEIEKQKVKALELELEIRKLCKDTPDYPARTSPWLEHTGPSWDEWRRNQVYGPIPGPFDLGISTS